MLYAGLDLSRQRLDVHLLREDGLPALVTAVAPDADALRTLVRRVAREGEPVRATIESMNGGRFVHDQLEFAGWEVLIADAAKVKLPEPWQATMVASLHLVDDLTTRVDALEVELQKLGVDHPSIPLLMTVPGVGWVLASTIASEIGDIGRFATPKKLAGYTGLCPFVRQSGNRDVRGPLAKNGPKYLRWALIEASIHAARHPRYQARYERTKHRLGRQRGAKVARVELARTLAEAIWHVLTKNEPFAPAGPAMSLVA